MQNFSALRRRRDRLQSVSDFARRHFETETDRRRANAFKRCADPKAKIELWLFRPADSIQIRFRRIVSLQFRLPKRPLHFRFQKLSSCFGANRASPKLEIVGI
jgi:hypothetical protein